MSGIVRELNILSSEWMLIGRQKPTSHGGRIDLLAIEQNHMIGASVTEGSAFVGERRTLFRLPPGYRVSTNYTWFGHSSGRPFSHGAIGGPGDR